MPLMAIRPSPALDTTGPPRPSVVVFITAAPYLGSDPFDLEDQAGHASRGELRYASGPQACRTSRCTMRAFRVTRVWACRARGTLTTIRRPVHPYSCPF